MPLTALIGRDQEVRAIGELLTRPEVRLLTITGTGGSCSGAVERLATLSHPARMAQSGPQPNHSFNRLPRPESSPSSTPPESVLTRARRAYWRLSWEQRLTRNARPADAPRLSVTLRGFPATFAHSFGFDLLATT